MDRENLIKMVVREGYPVCRRLGIQYYKIMVTDEIHKCMVSSLFVECSVVRDNNLIDCLVGVSLGDTDGCR